MSDETNAGPEMVASQEPEETIHEAVERLAALPHVEYAQRRKAEADALGIRTTDLDKAVKQAQPKQADEQQGRPLELEAPAPWDEPVDPVATLDEVQATLRRFVVADSPTRQAATLWAAFTHFIDVVKVAPIANITAPERNCGKSTLLGCLYRLSRCPLKADNISPSSIFRVIEHAQPTLLIDEVDGFLRDNEAGRNILNSGHEPDGCVIRNVGEDHEPHSFRTFGAKALCGIGSIQATLESRSIRLELRRKLPDEQAENLKFSDDAQWWTLQRKLARLAEDQGDAVRRAGEIPVPGLSNRAADNWQPLIAIADAVGGHWPDTARNAAHQLENLEAESPEIGAELLADVKAVLDRRKVSQIFTQDLLQELLTDGEAPWATWNRGKELSARQLSRMLKPYGGKSATIRIGNETQKGYRRADLEDALKRYLPDPPAQSVTPSQVAHGAGFSDSQSVTPDTDVTDQRSPEPLSPNGCDTVTDRDPLHGDEDDDIDVEAF